MKSPKLLSRILSMMSIDLVSKPCGRDDEELRHIAEELDKIDCGLTDTELKKAVEEYRSLPMESKIKIAEVISDKKLYEETICLRYGITRATIYRWQEKGKLPPFRRDGQGKKFIFLSEAEAWLSAFEDG